jgi:hypothetical protein
MGKQIYVPMPEPDWGKIEGGARDSFVQSYGTATVEAAERSVLLDLFIMTGIVKPRELAALIEQRCKQIDDLRRRQAMGDNG